jgi:heterotetrameric sarcosine oxidase gamma subunit
MTHDTLTARAAFNDLAFSSAPGRGVLVVERDGLGLASVLARKGQFAPLAERIRRHFGIELPRGPRRIASGAAAFAGIGPEAWLATSEDGGDAFASFLKQTIGDVAAVADQSSGYAILRLTGPKLRETLAKILPIDLHSRAFQPGDVASTTASHVGATLWRLQDAPDGSPVFEIAVFRSLAGSFWHCLASSAAEFGLLGQASVSGGFLSQ